MVNDGEWGAESMRNGDRNDWNDSGYIMVTHAKSPEMLVLILVLLQKIVFLSFTSCNGH